MYSYFAETLELAVCTGRKSSRDFKPADDKLVRCGSLLVLIAASMKNQVKEGSHMQYLGFAWIHDLVVYNHCGMNKAKHRR